jgi:hypothetical protein
MAMIVDCGQEIRPFIDGPVVRACDIELVRAEPCKRDVADGDTEKKANIRKKNFHARAPRRGAKT